MAVSASQTDDGVATLVSRAAAGEEAAFARIVAAYHDDMTRVCFVIAGDIDIADEAVQTAWSVAWRKLPTLRGADRIRPWLVSVAANETRQLLRRRRRRSLVELSVAEMATDHRSDPDPGGRTSDLDLANALARLDPKDRELLALRYVAGFDSTELARTTGLSPSGTRARLARLLDRLRTELQDD
jgi:RNA polymerase sigma-70 factor (ECF subfamily)